MSDGPQGRQYRDDFGKVSATANEGMAHASVLAAELMLRQGLAGFRNFNNG